MSLLKSDISQKDQIMKALQKHIQRCRELISLESKGMPVNPDRYILKGKLSSSIEQNNIRYEKILSYSRNEPRMELIKRNFERFIKFGIFLYHDKTINVDGFRLHNLRNWANFTVSTPEDNFPSISSYCNCDCEFCYEKGTRETPIFHRLGRKNLSLKEVDTRLRYYSYKDQKGIVPASYLALEAFLNPHCIEILERLHNAYPKSSIKLTTNGSFLTEDVVARLAKLKPILLMVSLNAGTVQLRQLVMHERSAESAQIAINSFALLKKYDIPAEGSYVPWPSKPLSDMEEALRIMDDNDVVRARICMPSFTKYHGIEPFDTETYWQEILSNVKTLRNKVSIPIDVIPNSYEFQTSQPIIHGTIKNSPAAKAGLRFGDRVMAIDGQQIYTITEMHGLLAQRAQDSSFRKTTYTIERDGKIFDVEIQHPEYITKEPYPYRNIAKPGGSRWANSLGIHYTGGFSLTNVVRFLEACKEYVGKRILLFTSEFMEPHFREALDMFDASEILDSVEIYVENPIHRFWGGNVKIGDLWTIPDLIAHTKFWMNKTGIRPDAVLVASSFLSIGKRDLLGNCYLNFERELDIELRLIPCISVIE